MKVRPPQSDIPFLTQDTIMNRVKVTLGAFALALAPLAAVADDMSYSFVDLAYVETDVDGVGPSADGFGARGSVGFADNYFAFAEFSSQSVSNVDIDQTAVGLGGHYGLAENLDAVGRIGWTKVDISAGPLDADDDGYLVDLGLRGRVGGAVELEGGLRYADFGGADGDDTSFFFGGRYHFDDTWAVGAEYRSGDDVSSIMAGVRISF
jgi:hypothetical protein